MKGVCNIKCFYLWIIHDIIIFTRFTNSFDNAGEKTTNTATGIKGSACAIDLKEDEATTGFLFFQPAISIEMTGKGSAI